MPDEAAELAPDETLLPPAALLAEPDALDASELAALLALLKCDDAELLALLKLASADVLFADEAEDNAEDKLELILERSLSTEEEADEATLEALELIEDRAELTALDTEDPVAATFEVAPIPVEASTGACASAGTAAMARTRVLVSFMLRYASAWFRILITGLSFGLSGAQGVLYFQET